MKKLIGMFTMAMLLLAFTAITTQAQDIPARAAEKRSSPNATVTQAIGEAVVTISYGRPGVKDREVFGGLVKMGETWRAGANEATVFATTADVTINGKDLPAGSYSVFAVPGESEWTLAFNSVAEQWGGYDYDAGKDALRVTATPVEAPHEEWMSFSFVNLTGTSADVHLRWATTAVPFTVALK